MIMMMKMKMDQVQMQMFASTDFFPCLHYIEIIDMIETDEGEGKT